MSTNFILSKKLFFLKIPLERYNTQFQNLCEAGFTSEQANRIVLRKFSNNTVLATLDNYQTLLEYRYASRGYYTHFSK